MATEERKGHKANPTDGTSTDTAIHGLGEDYTRFQFDILYILYDEPQYGLGIKGDLEDYYGEEVNHGRLYPNLDILIEAGYVAKSTLDKRTNLYELTSDGEVLVENRFNWAAEQTGNGGEE